MSKRAFIFNFVAMSMLIFPEFSMGAWWDDSWNYRKPVAITNNVETALYDYSMNINLNTADLISQGRMQGDCGDIRIIENGEEINYGIINPDSANTEIYFIANDLIVGDNNDIYIYYGNPDADNGFVENWKDAFYIWWDDFDTDRGWYDIWDRGGYYTVADGYLTIYFSPYIDGAYAPSDGSSFPMNGRVGIKTETKMMVLNNMICQGQISLSWGYPIGNISGGHNRYALAFSDLISKSISPNTWYTSETIYNRLTGDWYGNFDGDVTTGNRPALVSDDFSTIMVAGCNSNDPRVDYIYLRYFIEPEPNYSLGEEEIYSGVCPHDECVDAIPVQADEPYNGTTTGATGTDTSSCSYNDTFDVWHSFTPKFNYEYAISLCGSTFDTTLSVFDECGGVELACNDDTEPGICAYKLQSQLTVALQKGSIYFIRVAGYEGTTGDYVLTVTGPQCTEQIPGDVNNDCKIDFVDFAVIASHWLECNLDPPSVCWD